MVAAAITCTTLPTEANAQQTADQAHRIDLSATTLRRAIEELAHEAHVSIGTQGRLPNLRVRDVRGSMSVSQALAQLLDGSGYAAQRVGATAWRIQPAPPRTASASPAPATPSTAVDVSQLPDDPVPPIIVNATKTTRDLLGLPVAATRIEMPPSSAHQAQAGSNWVASRMEGMALTGLGAGRNRMFLRGVADSAFAGESQSTVAILLDSARITYSAPDPDLRLVDVQQVEVLKGPQGSLYGAGALGGIYQITTNRPQMGETSLAVSGDFSQVAKGQAGFGGTLVANLPVVADLAALRLVGYASHEAGWVDTGDRPDSNQQKVAGTRALLSVQPDPAWQIELGTMVQRIDTADSQYVYRAAARSRPAQLAEPHDNDFTLISGHIRGELGSLQLTFDGSYVWHEIEETIDATQGAETFGVADPLLLHDDHVYRISNVELRLDGYFGQADWLLGLARIETRQNLMTALESATLLQAATIDDDRRTIAETALFGSFQLPIGDRFHVEAGARMFIGVVRDTRQVAGEPISRHLHRTGLTPSLAVSWGATGNSLLFMRYGSALRQGGVDIDANGDFTSFASDELASLELGWRSHSQRWGDLEIGVYATRWNNMQADILQLSGLIETTNVGDARILGLDAGWRHEIGEGWHLSAGGSLTRARLADPVEGLGSDDRHLPVVPAYTLRAEVSRDIALGDVTGGIDLHLNYVGPSRLSFQPELDREMGDIFEGEAELHFDFGRWQASLAIENLFGCTDNSFAYGNRLRVFAGNQFTPLRPTTASFSIAASF